VRSLLDAYVAAANGKILLEVIDPRPFSEDEDRAVAFGIDGVTGPTGERLFFGLAATNSTTGRATIANRDAARSGRPGLSAAPGR
jgi:ABC-type uncharacterized transport system involved in gliding motility auxiliary subunit